MYPHHIRLRGPWQWERLASDPSMPATRGSVKMPCLWRELGLEGFNGLVRFRRRFGYPGRLDGDERLWLTCFGVANPSALAVNGTELAHERTGSFEFDITPLLGMRNELVFDASVSAATVALWDDVILEVRSTAFLRNVNVRPLGDDLEITGEVVGEAQRPLELYVLVNRRHSAYAQIAPRAEGQRFSLLTPLAPTAALPVSVQIDLVDAATVWYTMTRQVHARD